MKISLISDIHGDLETLVSYKNHAIETKPDVVVCAGDLTGPSLGPEETEKMHTVHDRLRANFKLPIPFNQLLALLEQEESIPEKAKEDIRTYTEIELKFNEKARQQYDKVLGIFTEFQQPVLTIPGNWDSTQYFEYLKRFDIHKKTTEIDGVEFTGYGGAVVPACLPPTRVVPYSEEELYKLLTKQIPEIAITHVPPKGILDKTSNKKHIGSWAGLAYIRNPDESSNLFLCGHLHGEPGVLRPEGLATLIVRAGNLGEYQGEPGKGYFAEINYNGPTEPIEVKRYKIGDKGKVYELKR